MPTRKKTAAYTKKPLLIQCGKNFINPQDVSSIREVRDGLFIVKFTSEPNPHYPCWVQEEDIGALLQHFTILEGAN